MQSLYLPLETFFHHNEPTPNPLQLKDSFEGAALQRYLTKQQLRGPITVVNKAKINNLDGYFDSLRMASFMKMNRDYDKTSASY